FEVSCEPADGGELTGRQDENAEPDCAVPKRDGGMRIRERVAQIGSQPDTSTQYRSEQARHPAGEPGRKGNRQEVENREGNLSACYQVNQANQNHRQDSDYD